MRIKYTMDQLEDDGRMYFGMANPEHGNEPLNPDDWGGMGGLFDYIASTLSYDLGAESHVAGGLYATEWSEPSDGIRNRTNAILEGFTAEQEARIADLIAKWRQVTP